MTGVPKDTSFKASSDVLFNWKVPYATISTVSFRAATQITMSVWVRLSGTSTDIYLIKDAPIPVGSSLSIDGKFNVASGDILRVSTDTANGLNLFVSLVDEISA